MVDYRFKLHLRYYWSLMINIKAERSKADYCNFDFRMSNSKSKSQAIFPQEMWSIKYISQGKCTSIILTLYSVFHIKQHWTSFPSLSTSLFSQDYNLSVIFNIHRNISQSLSTVLRRTWRKIQTGDHRKLQGRNLTLNVAPSWKHNQWTLNEVCLNCKVKNQMDW